MLGVAQPNNPTTDPDDDAQPAHHRKFQRVSLGCLTTRHPVRELCIRIVSNKWFDRAIVAVVIFNTIILGLTDYTHAWKDGPNTTIWINAFIETCNNVSFYIFLVESILKITAMGLCFGERAYLNDGWNRLDCLIVLSGVASMLRIKGVKVGYIRVLRILRPMRTLHSLPGLKVLTNSLLASLPALANVFVLLMFCMLIFAILGMEIYSGDLHFRCRVTPYPVQLPPNGTFNYPPTASYISLVAQSPALFPCLFPNGSQISQLNPVWDSPTDCFWPTDATEPVPTVCNEQPSVGRQCQNGAVCGSNYDSQGNPRFNYMLLPPWDPTGAGDDALFTSNLNYGLTSFDNLGRAWIIILQTITASGWMVLTQTTQSTGSPVVGGVFFVALMFLGMCFLLQLNMAVLFSEFDKAKAHHAKLMQEEKDRLLAYFATLPPGGRDAQHKQRRLSTVGTRVIKRMATAALSHGDVIVQTALWRRVALVRTKIRWLVASHAFTTFGLVVTAANILVLAMDYHGIDAATKTGFEITNFVFMLYFALESALKVVGLGVHAFWIDHYNQFDLVTVVMGIVEVAVHPPSFIDGTPGGGGFFTAFRAARAFKLARMWKSLNQLLGAIMSSLGEIANFMLFLALFMLIFSLIGMEFFATRYQFDPNNFAMPFNNSNPQTRVHRSNFDSLVWAAFTVFQYLTYDNFPAVMYDGWISVGAISPIFASLVIILGVFIVMNMFSAIMVQSVMDGQAGTAEANDDDDESGVQRLSPTDSILTPREESALRVQGIRDLRRAMRMLVRFSSITLLDRGVVPLDLPRAPPDGEQLSPRQRLDRKSLYLFAPSHPLRVLCVNLVKRREFTYAMSLVIFTSCVMTALDSPLLDPASACGQAIEQANLAFAILFSLEMALHVVARGLFLGPDAYIKDAWRILDGFIVFVSLLPYTLPNGKKGAALSGLRSLRAFRALRPLRVINKLPSLKVVINTLFRCIPDVARALLFFVFMLFLFGLMSMALFKGALYTCSVSPYNYGLSSGTPPWFPSDYTGTFNNLDLVQLEQLDRMTFPRAWRDLRPAERDALAPVWNQTGCGPFADDVVPTSRDMCLCFAFANGTTWTGQTPQKFDNIVVAVAGLFEMTTMEGWVAVALACIDAVGEDMQPIVNHNPLVMVYWWLFMIICAFFVTNLFIGVLCDSFQRETYGSLVTEEQIQWIKLQNKVLAMSPQRHFACPTNVVRAACFRIVTFAYFEHGITLVIVVNTTCMAVQVFGQSQATEDALSALNTIFSLIFVLEAAVKLTAYGLVYFGDNWNRFDCFVVACTFVNFILQACRVNIGAAATVVRVFRIGRALRLIKQAKIMKNLFDTLIVSLPAVVNVMSLLMLLYYIFAAVAVQLFAKVGLDDQMLTTTQNFQTFWVAFQTLIGFSTGENWDNFTWALATHAAPTNPTCDDRAYDAGMCGFNSANTSCVPLDGCGNGLVLPFMYLFFLVMGYIGINLFSGIVVDAIGDSSSDCPVNVNTLAEFADRWATFDPAASGLITAPELTDFLYTVYPPFGFKGVPGFTRRRVVIAIGELDIPIYDKTYVHFKDVPRALVQRVLAQGSRAKHAEITRTMEKLGINKQFDEMWFRAHGKKHQVALANRAKSSAKEYSAALIIQRFVGKTKLQLQRQRASAQGGGGVKDVVESKGSPKTAPNEP
ncbi:Aste57867_16338 [Aphanomyces stellatus]|uniref:Aste57867_16338 protein n=1 Tax=Aphanomyces stellatus TaxID=120398 RepID=A0A485L6K0_9STRA|nr:hypothetical protein As57867_016281 [Aphanomyces stellatus]VFT93114.1 Aste57867_16338 [Aphanomyces stellatus]